MIMLPAESLGRKQNHTDSLCRKPFFADGSLGRKQDFTVWAEAKYDGQSLQEVKISRLVYTLCLLSRKFKHTSFYMYQKIERVVD